MKAIDTLIAGFKQFHERYYIHQPTRIAQLIRAGQHPQILVIACCDSRVHPAMVFNTPPGDIFVIRNIANIVPPYKIDKHPQSTNAAIEFATKHLAVKHIIILGHSQCGGIRRLMAGQHAAETADYAFIDPWVKTASPVREHIRTSHPDHTFEEQCYHCELANIAYSLENLHGFPWVKSQLEAGTLYTHGWYFDFPKGLLLKRDMKTGQFEQIVVPDRWADQDS